LNAHYLRGEVLLEQQRYKEAAGQFQLALAEEPDNALFHAQFANALVRCDRWQQALDSVTTALTKDPSNPFAFWVMAMVRLERQQFAEAEQAIQSAIQLEPHDATNHGLLSRIHYERRNYYAALQATDAGLALDPSDDLCLTFRSRALMALGRAEEARQDADTLLADDPDDSWNHCLRGDQLLAEGDHNGARRHYLEALRIESHNAAARYGLALSLKARSPIYSVLLRGLLLLDRFSSRAIWLVLILVFVGMGFGNKWADAHPEWLVPYEAAKVLLWGATILLFVANPLFDLVLRFDRESRHVLTDDEIKATNWYLVCFGFAALCGVWAVFGKATLLARTVGVTALYFTRAVSEVFEATPGYVRRRMAGLAIAAALAVVLTPVILFVGIVWLVSTRQTQLLTRFILTVLWIPIAVMLFCSFVDDIRKYFENRRPDTT
jgi:tetratricopeptide (TPR) repeat protein